MQAYFIYIAIVIAILLIGWFIFSKVLKNKTPKGIENRELPISIDDLIASLGGIDNIKESVANGSKMTFFLNDDDIVKIDELKALGASGIIQSTGKITVIMGKFSTEISELVNSRK